MQDAQRFVNMIKSTHILSIVLFFSVTCYAQKTRSSYPWDTFVVADVTLRVSHDFWIVKDHKGRELARTPVPKYVNVATPLERYTLNGRHFIIWNGSYPHCSPCEFGALVYDHELRKFYRFHAVPNDDDDGIVVNSKIVRRDNKRYVQLIGDPPQEILQKFLLPGDVLVSGELCSADYCDDPIFGPHISQRTKDEEAEQDRASNRLLVPLGLTVGQKYSKARKTLLAIGWKPFFDDPNGVHGSRIFFEIETYGASGDGHRSAWEKKYQKLTISLCPDEKGVYLICGAEE